MFCNVLAALTTVLLEGQRNDVLADCTIICHKAR
jgi:hypothetical protein